MSRYGEFYDKDTLIDILKGWLVDDMSQMSATDFPRLWYFQTRIFRRNVPFDLALRVCPDTLRT